MVVVVVMVVVTATTFSYTIRHDRMTLHAIKNDG